MRYCIVMETVRLQWHNFVRGLPIHERLRHELPARQQYASQQQRYLGGTKDIQNV